MKSICLIFLILVFSPSTFAQVVDVVEAEILWESNIQAILYFDKEKVMNQTVFSRHTFDGDWKSYQIDMPG